MFHLLALAGFVYSGTQNVHVANTPTVGGLSSADLIAIVAILVTIFGLMLSAIGVLLMTIISNLREDMRTDIADLKKDIQDDLTAMWNVINDVRTARIGGRRKTDIPPDER